LLHGVLYDHYGTSSSDRQQTNIDLLKDNNTFTITTAHQPSLLGGPAYYFYKICSVINLARQLSLLYPAYKFVPVFISGAEDHDFDEVKSLHLFHKTVEWETKQHGAVGRFSTDGLSDVIQQVKDILGVGKTAVAIGQAFDTALSNADNYNTFVFNWLNYFFKDYGLLVVNMDDRQLKKAFAPIIKKEISEKKSIEFVQNIQESLLKLGFKPQAFAREVNIFYMIDGIRERIYFKDGRYFINNTDFSFSEKEIMEEVDLFPERFSPNVILRPLYQESILPDIAYIGGGGEVAYWLERKTQFNYFGIFYPVIIRRNSVMLLPKSLIKTMDKLDLGIDDFLMEEDKVITKYLERAADGDFHLYDEINEVRDIFKNIAFKARIIDPTLEPFVMGEANKILKTIESIEGRLKRAIKQKEETSVNQIKALRSKLFPDNGLQERKESLLQYLVTEDISLLDKLIEVLNPLEKEFLFINL
jgi:bacillithiol biosynthesis cysteine-adding enzyme BshC